MNRVILLCSITNVLCGAITTITGIWDDDFSRSTNPENGWDTFQSSSGAAGTNTYTHTTNIQQNGGDGKTYWGPFSNDINNDGTSERYTFFRRRFKCSSTSNIYGYYSMAYCGTETTDNTRIYQVKEYPFDNYAPLNYRQEVQMTPDSQYNLVPMPLPSPCFFFDPWLKGREKQNGVQLNFNGVIPGGEKFEVWFRQQINNPNEYAYLYDIRVECRASPTSSPTAKPTRKPTTKPTAKPTLKPTAKPSLNPTENPTASPVCTDGADSASFAEQNIAGMTAVYGGNNGNAFNIGCGTNTAHIKEICAQGQVYINYISIICTDGSSASIGSGSSVDGSPYDVSCITNSDGFTSVFVSYGSYVDGLLFTKSNSELSQYFVGRKRSGDPKQSTVISVSDNSLRLTGFSGKYDGSYVNQIAFIYG